ncbi:MAG TPA: SPOR domain-containing protein [Hyphomicrobiaceae bacterium]|nr:SPOR domain-containing protein [Hyphomicrobiaceae bacterium]
MIMARGWRRLVIAAIAAVAMATVCAVGAESQAPAKAQDQDAPAKAPAKKKKQDPVEAQRAIDAASRQLEAGKADQAVVALSTTLAGGNLPPALMAKALLYRGIAYRQQKKPAQAIADLTSALWLKGGLGDSDRRDALRQRSSAYQEAGLTETGEAIAPAVPPTMAQAPSAPSPQAQAPAATRTASAAKTWGAETTWLPTEPPAARPAPAQQSSGWDLFANLFGGSPSPAPVAPAPAAKAPAAVAPTTVAAAPIERAEPAPVVRRQAEPRAPAASGWSNNTQVQSGATPVVTGALPAKPEGKFRIQVGIVRTQGEADALAAKVKQEHGALLAAREMEIDQAVVGNMGSFYRVRVGPFATQQETNVICARLKGTGLDCLVVTQ